jgi:predicted DNA-binding WGR domain protein
MRRFEFVGGSSSKFWEIAREGAQVTVTFGRIGTAGQTQVKDLGTEAAGIKYFDSLVAEKVKKGYVERPVGGDSITHAPAAQTAAAQKPAPATPAAAPPTESTAAPLESARTQKKSGPQAAPREDDLVIPPGWRRSMHPRRGSVNIGPLNFDATKAKATVDQTRSRSP